MHSRVAPVLATVTLICASAALAGFAGTDLFIPMAGRGVGAYPSNWFTTVYLYNPNPTAVAVDLSFLERNKDNVATAPPRVTETLAPGETKVYENIVEATFGTTAYGAVRIQSSEKVVATARVFSKESADAPLAQSFGQDFAAAPASFAIGKGEFTDILGGYTTQPYQDSEARFNIGCVETTGLGSATVRWLARDAAGQEQKDYVRTVLRLSQTQGIFHDYFPGVDLTNARISANVIAGSGKVICYGSLVTNDKTFPKPVQDPTTFEMVYPDKLLAASVPTDIGGSGETGQLAFWSGEKTLSGTDALHWEAYARRLSLAGTLLLPSTSPADGQLWLGGVRFLHGYGIHGYGSGNSFLGSNAGNFIMSGGNNTGVGFSALKATTLGRNNTAVGAFSLEAATSGSQNTAVGSAALRSNTTGEGNTAVGSMALGSTTGGHYNTAVGNGALLDMTTGYHNTAVGCSALISATTAAGNTAVGFAALNRNTEGTRNTALGSLSLDSNTVGQNNVAVGTDVLSGNTSGAFNTAVGSGALHNVLSGDANVAVGAAAGQSLEIGSGNIYLGGDAGEPNESGTIRVGTAGTHTRAFVAGVHGVTTDVADAIPVVVDSSGQLGTISSSARFKQDIEEIGGASEALALLHPVTFRYKSHPQSTHFGLIAEEVAEVLPELVVRGTDGRPETVLYHELPALLLAELQRHRQRLVEQEERLAVQQAEIAELRRRLAGLAPGASR